MIKKNCWEYKGCGRQPGGDKTEELGVCPVAIFDKAHGINKGINGGRSCWAIEGTLCGGKVQGTFAQKMSDCMNCEFYISVRTEEGTDYQGTKDILKQLNGSLKKGTEPPLNTSSLSGTFSSKNLNRH